MSDSTDGADTPTPDAPPTPSPPAVPPEEPTATVTAPEPAVEPTPAPAREPETMAAALSRPLPKLSDDEVRELLGIDPNGPKWPTSPVKGNKTRPAADQPALAFVLGGAPISPHRVDGLPGYYRPDVPTPCDGPGEPTIDQALAYDAMPGAPVTLVYLTADEVTAAREQLAADFALVRNSFLEQRKHAIADSGEADQLADELQTLKGA